jgi:hypothetical protein
LDNQISDAQKVAPTNVYALLVTALKTDKLDAMRNSLEGNDLGDTSVQLHLLDDISKYPNIFIFPRSIRIYQ